MMNSNDETFHSISITSQSMARNVKTNPLPPNKHLLHTVYHWARLIIQFSTVRATYKKIIRRGSKNTKYHHVKKF